MVQLLPTLVAVCRLLQPGWLADLVDPRMVRVLADVALAVCSRISPAKRTCIRSVSCLRLPGSALRAIRHSALFGIQQLRLYVLHAQKAQRTSSACPARSLQPSGMHQLRPCDARIHFGSYTPAGVARVLLLAAPPRRAARHAVASLRDPCPPSVASERAILVFQSSARGVDP